MRTPHGTPPPPFDSPKQPELPFPKAEPTCVFCTSPKGKLVETVVKFVHLDDARGNHYAQVLLPTCAEHEHIPTIHYRLKGTNT